MISASVTLILFLFVENVELQFIIMKIIHVPECISSADPDRRRGGGVNMWWAGLKLDIK